MIFFGITVASFLDIYPGSHPIVNQYKNIYENDFSVMGIAFGIIGGVFIGYIIFSVWVLCALVIYLLMIRFDDDLKSNLQFIFNGDEGRDAKLSAGEISDMSVRVFIFTMLSANMSFILLSLLYAYVPTT